LLVLLGCWLAVGYEEDFFREQLAHWQQRLVPSLQKAPQTTTYDPATGRVPLLLYGLLYCGLSVLIIQVYFGSLKTTALALGVYAGLLLVTVVINEAGKTFDFSPFRVTAYRIMTLINSPMLLILLFCTLHFTSPHQHDAPASGSN
jgi:hypothetical protein